MTVKEYEELTPFQRELLEELKRIRLAIIQLGAP